MALVAALITDQTAFDAITPLPRRAVMLLVPCAALEQCVVLLSKRRCRDVFSFTSAESETKGERQREDDAVLHVTVLRYFAMRLDFFDSGFVRHGCTDVSLTYAFFVARFGAESTSPTSQLSPREQRSHSSRCLCHSLTRPREVDSK